MAATADAQDWSMRLCFSVILEAIPRSAVKYQCIGQQVNLAGRIESYSVGGQVLISKSALIRTEYALDISDNIMINYGGEVLGKVTEMTDDAIVVRFTSKTMK